MSKRRLTPAEKALIEKIAAASSQNGFTTTRPRVVVSDEVDERGQIQWITTMALTDVLPNA